ncbi:hypothetical protein BDV23DRAFT_145210 [Aspergillus alliaceus]|uniref:Uncharacterized protein n=1 Tax=Petromyces alliaceus TaxID=209559 RepID=A0A5N7CNW9_PETAA|nr:hypothetical protein BDV23DRAFT_145210 [Aspergillus alliaceus]
MKTVPTMFLHYPTHLLLFTPLPFVVICFFYFFLFVIFLLNLFPHSLLVYRCFYLCLHSCPALFTSTLSESSYFLQCYTLLNHLHILSEVAYRPLLTNSPANQ